MIPNKTWPALKSPHNNIKEFILKTEVSPGDILGVPEKWRCVTNIAQFFGWKKNDSRITKVHYTKPISHSESNLLEYMIRAYQPFMPMVPIGWLVWFFSQLLASSWTFLLLESQRGWLPSKQITYTQNSKTAHVNIYLKRKCYICCIPQRKFLNFCSWQEAKFVKLRMAVTLSPVL